MKGLFIISCVLATLVQLGYGNDPLTLEMSDTSDRKVQPGADNVEFDCLLNRDAMFLLTNKVEFFHEFSWNGETTRHHLFTNANPEADADPDVWSIDFTMSDKAHINFHAVLNGVTAMHNGRFTCETEDDDGNKIVAGANIVVYEQLKEIELTVHGQTFSDDSETELQLELDEPHEAHCRVMGSNPGAESVQILFGGQSLDTGDNVVEPMVTDTPQWSTKTGTAVIKTTKGDEGKVVRCEARGPSGELLRASTQLAIILRSPNISCGAVDAYPGKKYVFMECVVDTTGVPGNISMSVRVNTIGATIDAGSEKTLKGDRIVVVKEELPLPNNYKIQIKIAEVQDWHLNTDYTLTVRSKGGHLTTGVASLVRVDTPPQPTDAPGLRSDDDEEGTGSGVIHAPSLTLVCVVTLMTLLRLL